MQTLDSPVFELSENSDYYKKIKKNKDVQPDVNKVLDRIAEKLGVKPKEFLYYTSSRFGFEKYTDAYEKYRESLKKHPDRNGINTFKVNTKEYKEVKPMLIEIEEMREDADPFELHNIFGLNNAKASHWIGDRFFVGVKSEKVTKSVIEERKDQSTEPVKEISYKEYLKLVVERIENQE